MLKVGRGAHAPPFIVMDVIAAANARQRGLPPGSPHVIRMEVGQPGTGAPAGAVRAAVAALQGADPLGYTEALGRPSLRARIAAHYQEWYGLDLAPSAVAVTMGASGAFPLAFLAVRATCKEHRWWVVGVWTLLAFAVFFWSGQGILLWKAGLLSGDS